MSLFFLRLPFGPSHSSCPTPTSTGPLWKASLLCWVEQVLNLCGFTASRMQPRIHTHHMDLCAVWILSIPKAFTGDLWEILSHWGLVFQRTGVLLFPFCFPPSGGAIHAATRSTVALCTRRARRQWLCPVLIWGPLLWAKTNTFIYYKLIVSDICRNRKLANIIPKLNVYTLIEIQHTSEFNIICYVF